jgi:hypothetical protein
MFAAVTPLGELIGLVLTPFRMPDKNRDDRSRAHRSASSSGKVFRKFFLRLDIPKNFTKKQA